MDRLRVVHAGEPRQVDELDAALASIGSRLPEALVRYMRGEAEGVRKRLERRFEAGRAVEGHGDLRLEHCWRDEDGSTLELFESMADHVTRKSAPTFPSDAPDREIDFLLHSRPTPSRPGWAVESVEVVPEAVASDHRPVRAVLRLAPGPAAR